jgi:predicted nuclease of predicted toxin-antitoxin system
MRFLADEGCDGQLVADLRADGHDILYVVEQFRGADDDYLLDVAVQQRRILITEDKDFGELVFRKRLPHVGIILIRLDVSLRQTKSNRLRELIIVQEMRLHQSFVVIQNTKTRVRKINL